MSDRWTVLNLLNVTKAFFEKKGIVDSARLDAELLLAKALDCRRIDLYVRFDQVVAEPQLTPFRDMVRLRGERKPVKQILGSCEFMSHEFEISHEVLTPRPETELLVEMAVAALDDEPRVAVDLGTGSGNVAISIALAKPHVIVHATDISGEALAVASRNVERHGLSDRVRLYEGDWFGPVEGLVSVDLVVSNPPYVAEDEYRGLEPEITRYEPRQALVADQDGAGHGLRIVADSVQRLRPGGRLLLELSPQTIGRVAEAAEQSDAFDEITVRKDLGGAERVLQARRKTGT
jgi:release factor glutamine methyltransferase